MRRDSKLLRQLTISKNLQQIVTLLENVSFPECFRTDFFSIGKSSVQVTNIQRHDLESKLVVKTAFWKPPIKRHLSTFEADLVVTT